MDVSPLVSSFGKGRDVLKGVDRTDHYFSQLIVSHY